MRGRGVKTVMLLVVSLLPAVYALAINDWFAVNYHDSGIRKLFGCKVENLDSAVYLTDYNDYALQKEDEQFPTTLGVFAEGKEPFFIPVDSLIGIRVRDNVPLLRITTDLPVEEVPDKENYLSATIEFFPSEGSVDTLISKVNIRGRGNTTWEMPKKPYRLKFDKKQSLAGLPKAKSFVLIANYLDNTLMKNAVAFEMARLLDMPYANEAVPVDLVFNGEPRGSYMLTQKVGINAGSVDIDEMSGVMWEIDSYFDEEYKFRSTRYNLPCMIKDPDFLEIAEGDTVTAKVYWEYWRGDLDLAINQVYNGRWQDVFDAGSLVDYLLVNHLLGNLEITQAKSIYLYKEGPGMKYKFGPVWDFDWALGFFSEAFPAGTPFIRPDNAGYDFWMKIVSDPAFIALFRERLDNFEAEGMEKLMTFIDEYADRIRISASKDAEIWPEEAFYGFKTREINKSRFEENVDILKDFIMSRLRNIRNRENLLLY